MDENLELKISFDGVDPRKSSQLAADLEGFLLTEGYAVKPKRERISQDNMDLGTILTIILQSGAITAIAIGIQKWLSRPDRGTITVEKKGSKMVVKNINSKDAAKVIEEFGKATP